MISHHLIISTFLRDISHARPATHQRQKTREPGKRHLKAACSAGEAAGEAEDACMEGCSLLLRILRLPLICAIVGMAVELVFGYQSSARTAIALDVNPLVDHPATHPPFARSPPPPPALLCKLKALALFEGSGPLSTIF